MHTNTRLALFAEAMLTGLLVFLASLPVVTAFAAFTAGCAALRDRGSEGVGVRPYSRLFLEVLRTGPGVLVIPALVPAVLLADWVALHAGAPGAQVLFPVLLIGSAVFAMRTATAWRPERSWRAAMRLAAASLRDDLYGTFLLALAVLAALLIGVMIPIIAPLILGQVVLACLAVEARH